nr:MULTISPECIES: DUF2235 domain-containing protein [Bradyrhizobium]
MRGSPCANFKHADWLQQVWFAGSHSDVGASYYGKRSPPLLAVALRQPLGILLAVGRSGLALHFQLHQ